MTPQLDHTTTDLQIVDGNNWLMNHFRADTGGLIIRNLMVDIQCCSQPPLFVFDGPAGNERRRKLLPKYKVRSVKTQQSKESIWPTLELFRSLMPMMPAVSIRLFDWEADDVIATIACYQASQSKRSRIVSGDRDLSQLAMDASITVTAMLDDVPPHLVRLYKTCVGDPSDNIPGIPRFGDRAWEKLNKALMQTAIENSDDLSRFTAEELGMSTTHHSWCCASQATLQLYWAVIGLMDVPLCDITNNLVVGRAAPKEIDKILAEFML